ncbi:hypothetical protein NE237_022845 [Protea cynaroides]|uniref:Uncharacterized protein n=1 Tax=Protea cynaroides TaxID=273540 RepID=A0A9Q0HCR4_9MAGN|nr:hypothetical protein NE237_022845 [Protea cynaroides]
MDKDRWFMARLGCDLKVEQSMGMHMWVVYRRHDRMRCTCVDEGVNGYTFACGAMQINYGKGTVGLSEVRVKWGGNESRPGGRSSLGSSIGESEVRKGNRFGWFQVLGCYRLQLEVGIKGFGEVSGGWCRATDYRVYGKGLGRLPGGGVTVAMRMMEMATGT